MMAGSRSSSIAVREIVEGQQVREVRRIVARIGAHDR
jgi:hypothetical protein